MLGLWATVSASGADMVTFEAMPLPMADAPIWRANFPADIRQAQAHLADGQARLFASQNALRVAAKRLQSLVDEGGATGLSFDIASTGSALPPPEAELLVVLRQIQEGQAPVSFGLGDRLAGGWEQATHSLAAVLEQLRQHVAYYAWVETRVQEQLVGQTTVSWTGDMDTVWRVGLSQAQVRLHQSTLGLALGSRDTLMRTFVMAAQLAIKLSALLMTPAGVILALPAVWKFINQVRAEFGQQQ
jgi:hypothetical protein